MLLFAINSNDLTKSHSKDLRKNLRILTFDLSQKIETTHLLLLTIVHQVKFGGNSSWQPNLLSVKKVFHSSSKIVRSTYVLSLDPVGHSRSRYQDSLLINHVINRHATQWKGFRHSYHWEDKDQSSKYLFCVLAKN